MLWTPTGPTVAVGTSSTPFANPNNLGGVARLVNTTGGGAQTFSLGGAGVTNTQVIPLALGQDIIIAYGPGVTDAIASAAGIFITPGIGRP